MHSKAPETRDRNNTKTSDALTLVYAEEGSEDWR